MKKTKLGQLIELQKRLLSKFETEDFKNKLIQENSKLSKEEEKLYKKNNNEISDTRRYTRQR